MSFFTKIKEAFGSKPAPKFKTYQPSELKMLSIKTRIILEKHMETLFQQITKDDQQFRYAGQDPFRLYNILQEIGQKVIEAESIKILVEMMRKVENFSPQIIQTNGDITLLRKELLWFQCVLWYRQSREKTDLEDLYHFCYDFFKGVDITTQLDVHCEVFQLYPILKYLPKKGPIPLSELLPYIQPYVSCDIDQPTLDNILDINRNEIIKGESNNPQGQSYIPPGQINQPQSKFYQKSHVYTPFQPPQQKNQPSNINPYLSNNYNQSNQGNPPFNNPFPNNYSQLNPNSPSKNPQLPIGGNLYPINNNTFNGPTNNNMSNIDPYNLPNLNPYSHASNTLNINANQNYFSRIDQPQLQPQPQPQPQPQYQPQVQPHQPPSHQKQSFYNTIMRGSFDRQREPIENDYNDHYGSKIPFNRDTHQQFNDISFEQTMKQLEQLEKKQSQTKLEKQKEQRERQQRQRREKQQMEKQQRRIQEVRHRQEQQQKTKKEQEERRIRERQEQERREREEAERQKEQQNRRRQRQRQMEERDNDFQINVFKDNEREEIDRGTSGRFSTNFGMKIDFGDHREEDFNYESPSSIQDSLLRFKQVNESVAPIKNNQNNFEVVPEQQLHVDQRQSLNIISNNAGCSPATNFKLFYFKKTQTV